MSDRRILHLFADHGIEAEALAAYGDVVRVGWEARDSNESQPIRADVTQLPIADDARFDLVVAHPPCTRWSDMTSVSGGDPDDHPNLIPLARELGQKYGAHYVVENKPQAPLEAPDGGSVVTLTGKQFGLPLKYERGFETSFPVKSWPAQQSLDTETSPYFYADRSREWWAGAKGYAGPYSKTALAKNCVPAAYVHFLCRQWLNALGGRDSEESELVTRRGVSRPGVGGDE